VIEEDVSFDVLVSRLLTHEDEFEGEDGESGPVRTIAGLEKQIAKLRRYDGIRASFVRVSKRDDSDALELLEELFGDLDDEDRPKSRRVYDDPAFGFADTAVAEVRVMRAKKKPARAKPRRKRR
jgi:hypothetical protein